jgi:hypothetical protein
MKRKFVSEETSIYDIEKQIEQLIKEMEAIIKKVSLLQHLCEH